MQTVVIYGGSGFIGTLLSRALLREGYRVVVADMKEPRVSGVAYHPVDVMRSLVKHDNLRNPYAVVNLVGKNIVGRFTEAHRHDIYRTRVNATRHIVRMFEDREYQPSVFVNASAVGLYGDRGGEVLNEDSPPGSLYLSRVVEDWETEARIAESFHVRTVVLRQGIVLGPGGILGMLLPIYRLGLGGPIGNGEQWFSWIHYEDVVGLYIRALSDARMQGAYNATAHPVKQKEFSLLLARTLHRPHLFRVPKWALRMRYGDFADELCASQRVIPERLSKESIHLNHNDIAHALWSMNLRGKK